MDYLEDGYQAGAVAGLAAVAGASPDGTSMVVFAIIVDRQLRGSAGGRCEFN